MKLVGERRALAASVFAFYFLIYGLFVILGPRLGVLPPELVKAFAAITGVYGLAFFALVAGYFWARWYAVGVGLYGVITSAVGYIQARNNPDLQDAIPVLIFIGGTHLVATLLLWGNTMAQPYDGQTRWREKLHMDDNAVQRLGRSVIRAGLSLPFILLYALGPKQAAESMWLALGAFVLAGLGLRALIKARTWGVLATAMAGALMVTLAGADLLMGAPEVYALRPALAGGLLLSAVAPWLAPLARTFASSATR